MNYQEFVSSRAKWLDSIQQDMVHSAMGLLGECVEFSEAKTPQNYLEELGDLEFYYEHAAQTVAKIPAHAFTVVPIGRAEAHLLEVDPLHWITHWSAGYHNLAKKAWVHNKPLPDIADEMNAALVRVQVCLHFLASRLQKTREDIQALNRSKLEQRYPTGYSDAAAQARADKAITGETT